MAITLQGAFLPGSMAANPAAERKGKGQNAWWEATNVEEQSAQGTAFVQACVRQRFMLLKHPVAPLTHPAGHRPMRPSEMPGCPQGTRQLGSRCGSMAS